MRIDDCWKRFYDYSLIVLHNKDVYEKEVDSNSIYFCLSSDTILFISYILRDNYEISF